MKSAVSVPAVGIEAEPKQTLRSQLAEYVSQQPASKQTFHKWMGILEVASLAIPVGVFAIALYLSFRWTVVPTNAIPVAWFCVPLSFTPFLILVGLHAIVLQAFPPNNLMGKTLRVYPPPAGQLGKKLQFRVGRQAVLWGWGLGERCSRLRSGSKDKLTSAGRNGWMAWPSPIPPKTKRCWQAPSSTRLPCTA